MTFDEVAVELGLEDVDEAFPHGWEDSERSFPDSKLRFLDEAFIAENGSLVALDTAAIDGLTAVADRVPRNPALAHLLCHEHRL